MKKTTKSKSKVWYGSSDDYVTMVTNDLHFYYGYEVTLGDPEVDDEPVEWCFQISTVKRAADGLGFKSEKPFFLMTTSQIKEKLPNTHLVDPRDYLIAGIGIFNEQLNKKFKKLNVEKTVNKKGQMTFTIANIP